jgi:hypothetical protein
VHQAVLDAVVHHLRVVTGAVSAGVDEPEVAGRLERVEDRLDLLDVGRFAADHQRVPVLATPDAAGHAAVDVADALGAQPLGPRLVVVELRVPTVDDDVAGRQQRTDLVDQALGRGHRHHDPHDARRIRQLVDHLGQAADVGDLRIR